MRLRSFFFAAGSSLLLLNTSCKDGNTKKVEDFANNFARLASDNQLDSIIAMYPAAEYADAISLTYNADSIKVNGAGDDGVYNVYLGNGATLSATVSPEGAVTVKETKGLFVYPEPKLEFARRIGAMRNEMNDEKLAMTMMTVDNLSTELFNEYVASRKNAIKNLGLTVTKQIEFMMDLGEGYYTLKNTTDQPIGGDEYTITWQYDYIGMAGESSTKDIKPGVDIPASGTVRVPVDFTGHSFTDLKAITMSTPSQESFFKNYKPTGNEYSDYVKRYGDQPVSTKKLSYGPYAIAGKLGGKYPIHITLEKGMKKGSYYYDKSGPKNKLDLVVKAFNDRTGELTLEEMSAKGEITGTFIGKLTPETFTGKMSSYTGKTYDFTLNVTAE